MPQLNPNPWFVVLVFSWAVFLTFIPTKILNNLAPNEPAPMSKEKHMTNSWTWPW